MKKPDPERSSWAIRSSYPFRLFRKMHRTSGPVQASASRQQCMKCLRQARERCAVFLIWPVFASRASTALATAISNVNVSDLIGNAA
ncbi:hypothetical protein, partial [Burkholderia sp. BCC0801]|uniref:hypothetical protein n=1 Tax=Burkholderia sp. BCC0801 TaxID=2676291 RepID=UPI001ABA5277